MYNSKIRNYRFQSSSAASSAAPIAPTICGSGGTKTGLFVSVSRRDRAQGFSATPPAKNIFPADETRFKRLAERLMMALWIPRATSRRSAPCEMRDMTSDSANTVHMLFIFSARFANMASAANSSRVNPSAAAITSKNRPVPAAQRSFISNLHRRPLSSREIAFVSWPPISRIDWQSFE